MPHKPEWFRDGQIFVSYAETVGINKDGLDLHLVDPSTGKRTEEIDNRLARDVDRLREGETTPTSRWINQSEFDEAVPVYYDDRSTTSLSKLLENPEMHGLEIRTLGNLIEAGTIVAGPGHGSPSADRRGGDVPYIKVSDIRAGQVNINPSNMVSEVVAREFWRGLNSGIEPFDLITPIRSSKNIGEFAIIMPGQEHIVVTKEVLILRPSKSAGVDPFFLLWALSLKVVRDQWRRVAFMQTNREDVGTRYMEIELPWPGDSNVAQRVSKSFRDYYLGVERLRSQFISRLQNDGLHHVFLGATPEVANEDSRATGEES